MVITVNLSTLYQDYILTACEHSLALGRYFTCVSVKSLRPGTIYSFLSHCHLHVISYLYFLLDSWMTKNWCINCMYIELNILELKVLCWFLRLQIGSKLFHVEYIVHGVLYEAGSLRERNP